MQFCHQRQTNSSTGYIVGLKLNLNIEMWLDFPGEFILMRQLPVVAAAMDPFTSSLTSLLTNSAAIQTSANMSSWTHEVIGKKAIGFCCRTGVSLGQTATEGERKGVGIGQGWHTFRIGCQQSHVARQEQQPQHRQHQQPPTPLHGACLLRSI
jgi:hypothetical protein